jgi:hypothetical protein
MTPAQVLTTIAPTRRVYARVILRCPIAGCDHHVVTNEGEYVAAALEDHLVWVHVQQRGEEAA